MLRKNVVSLSHSPLLFMHDIVHVHAHIETHIICGLFVCLSTHANTQIVGHVLLTALCGLMYGKLLSCTYCQFLVAPYYM